MVSLARGYPFGLINLLDVANTAGPLLMDTEHLAALGAWCFTVVVGVMGGGTCPRPHDHASTQFPRVTRLLTIGTISLASQRRRCAH